MLSAFEMGIVAHLIADWPLQNQWMVVNKTNLLHPAAWVHAGIHGLLLGFVLGWQAGAVLGLLHILIDNRVLLWWWQTNVQQTVDGPAVIHTRIWTDQVVHIALIAAWIQLLGAQ